MLAFLYPGNYYYEVPHNPCKKEDNGYNQRQYPARALVACRASDQFLVACHRRLFRPFLAASTDQGWYRSLQLQKPGSQDANG